LSAKSTIVLFARSETIQTESRGEASEKQSDFADESAAAGREPLEGDDRGRLEKSGRFTTTRNRPLMNYPYVTFYLEAQRAKRNLLHVFEADLSLSGLVLPTPEYAPAQLRKKKADSRLNLSEPVRHSGELFGDATRKLMTPFCPDKAGG
jgi:hypothetical protein